MTDTPQPVWKVIATANTLIEAEMIAERLKNAGIPAFVQRESIASSYAFTVGPLAAARIVVPESMFQEALEELGIDEDDDEQYVD